MDILAVWGQKLRSTSLFLVIGGAAASVLSYFSGDAEADRLWDTMSPAAQQILLSSNGPDYLSHAVLGRRLMYAFLILAAWRVMFELSNRLRRTRVVFLFAAIVAAGALLYQGKTGGELVYEHGVGMAPMTGERRKSDNRPKTNTLSILPQSVDLTLVLKEFVGQQLLIRG
jgi:uncharacterized membrane protein